MCRTLTSVSASFSYSCFWRKVLQRATLDTRTRLNTGSTCYNNNNNKERLKQQQQLQWGAQTNCKYLQTAGKQICVLRALPYFYFHSRFFFCFLSLLIYQSAGYVCRGYVCLCVCRAPAIGNTRALRLLILHKIWPRRLVHAARDM